MTKDTSNKKTNGYVLIFPDPLSIETEGLGRILISHWTMSAISMASKVIGKGQLTPDQFMVEFVEELGRIPSNDKKQRDQYENGHRIPNPETLTAADRGNIAKEYINKWKHEILYWVADEDDRESLDLDKNEGESDLDYFYRIVKISVEKSEEQTKKTFEKLNYFGSTKRFIDEFTRNQQKLDAVSEKIKGIQNTTIEALNFQPLNQKISQPLPNPAYKSNQLLKTQVTQLEGLSSLVAAQGEQAVLLNKQTDLLLRESAKSSAQAKIGVWVAAVGICLGTLLSAYSIYRSINYDKDAGEFLNQLMTIERQRITDHKESVFLLGNIENGFKSTHDSIDISSENTAQILEQIKAITKTAGKKNPELANAINKLTMALEGSGTRK